MRRTRPNRDQDPAGCGWAGRRVGRLYLVTWLIALAASSATAGSGPPMTLVLEAEPVTPLVHDSPVGIVVAPVEGRVSEDRWNPSDAFAADFVSEFREGLIVYLRKAGFRVQSQGPAAEVVVTLREFEGRRTSAHHGGDLRGSVLISVGDARLVTRELSASVDFEDPSAPLAGFNQRYHVQTSSLATPILYELSRRFYATIAQTLADRGEALAVALRDSEAIDKLSARRSDSAGHLSVASVPDGAEVYVDTKFVGTTPTAALPLSAGDHDVAVRKTRFEVWKRTITILSGGDQTIRAELDPEKKQP